MVDWLATVGRGAWGVWVEMAPYLLFGFAVAGILSVWLSAGWVKRHLGGHGWRDSLRAALFGVPLPLCSCSVIPVSASLRAQGAGRGATAAFMMSTPQVGVNSLVVSYGMLGPLLTAVRALVAFFSGWICGVWVDRAVGPDGDRSPATPAPERGADANSAPSPQPSVWRRILRHAFVVLPRSITAPLLVGIGVSALLGALLPPDFFVDRLRPGLPAMLMMMTIGIPLYVCSTSSVPVALMLIHTGVPEGAALVFLVTGPATNAATLTTLMRLLGGRATAIYLVVLASTALLAGWTLDALVLTHRPDLVSCHLPHETAALWKQLAGVVLVLLLAAPLAGRLRRR